MHWAFTTNRSPQPIPPTNNVNPTNQGNNNTQARGRGSIELEGVETEVEVKAFIKMDLPICWWCKGNVSQEEAQHRIQDCPIYKEYRENWWKTYSTNLDTTTPSNPEQEEN